MAAIVVDPDLLDVRHLQGLPLATIQNLLAPAFDPTYAHSLPVLLEALGREELGTARVRFLVVRIAGDAISLGAARLAREITAAPLSHAILQQVRATLALSEKTMREAALLPPLAVASGA